MFLLSQLRKDLLWDLSYKISFFGQIFLIALTVITFFFISETFTNTNSIYLEEYKNNYFFFAILGISLLDLITFTLRSASQSIREAQILGYLDSLLNSKININYLVFNFMIYPFLKGILRILIYYIFASTLIQIEISFLNFLIIIILSSLCFVSFIGFGYITAAFIIKFKQGDPINFLIGFIISIFSGILFPVTVLPSEFFEVSRLIPITHGLEMIRKIAIFNSLEFISFYKIFYMSLFGIFFISLGMYTLKRSIYSVKKNGDSNNY